MTSRDRWLVHIAPRAAWDVAQARGDYRAASLDAEGFIHCSTPEQVLRVADARYAGQAGLVLLCIAAEAVAAPIRYEDCYASGEAFPHLYGPLNLEAVVEVVDFPPGAAGRFAMPPRAARIFQEAL